MSIQPLWIKLHGLEILRRAGSEVPREEGRVGTGRQQRQDNRTIIPPRKLPSLPPHQPPGPRRPLAARRTLTILHVHCTFVHIVPLHILYKFKPFPRAAALPSWPPPPQLASFLLSFYTSLKFLFRFLSYDFFSLAKSSYIFKYLHLHCSSCLDPWFLVQHF